VEVNGEKTQLAIKELALTPVSLALMGAEYSSDCCVLVYAVDDTKSFGEQICSSAVLVLLMKSLSQH
jgi:hypothetical protein